MSGYTPGALGEFLSNSQGETKKMKSKKKAKEVEEEVVKEAVELEEEVKGDPSTSEPVPKKTKRTVKLEDSEDESGEAEEEEVAEQKGKIKESVEQKARTVFIGNLPLSTTRKQLKNLFRSCGAVETARLRCAFAADPKLPKKAVVIKKAFHKEATSIRGFVRFKEIGSVDEAIKLNGTVHEEHHIRVDRVIGRTKKYNGKRSIFLGNLAFNIGDEAIFEHFADCGDIEAVRVVRDKYSGMGKGFGYVLFKDSGANSLALKLNGSQLNGRPVRVTAVVDKNMKKKTDKSSITALSKPKKKKSEDHSDQSSTPADGEKRNRPKIKVKKSLEELLSDKPPLNNILRKKMKKRRQASKRKV